MKIKCKTFDNYSFHSPEFLINEFITNKNIKREDVISISTTKNGTELWYWGE